MKKEFLGKFNVYCSEIHRFGTDAVLLADFAKPQGAKKVCDLGTGCGIIPLLMLQKNEKLNITAIDIQKDAISLLKTAVDEQNLADKIIPICCDLKEIDKSLYSRFDVVTINPPYKRQGAGLVTGVDGIDIARNEIKCNVDDICKSAYKLLNANGKFFMCNRPERLADMICSMRENGIEPKILRNVCIDKNAKPMLVLLCGVKGAKSGMIVEKDLFLQDDNGEDTAEVQEIYSIIRGKK